MRKRRKKEENKEKNEEKTKIMRKIKKKVGNTGENKEISEKMRIGRKNEEKW